MSPDPIVVRAPPLLDGVRVDRAVAMLTGISRAAASALVADGGVRVDRRVVFDRSLPLRAGAQVEITLVDSGEEALVPEPDTPVDVVAEDRHVVVVDKPPGLVVHPGAGRSTGTLAAGLLARYPELGQLVAAGVCDPLRPGIVHRLDQGTSGLLAVARTELAYRSLVDQLSSRTVSRRYLALVVGHVAEERGVVDAPIGRSARTPTLMAVSARGRPARTGYEVLAREEREGPVTLLAVRLETGRTHQIRVHLAAIGHPVVGDDRYGAAGGPPGLRLVPGRLFLHADRLAYDDPESGERRSFESPLPEDLSRAFSG